MNNSFLFKVNSLFSSICYDPDGNSWTFVFSDDIIVGISGFWRLTVEGQIRLVSSDHGHLFGLKEPLDVVEETEKMLKNQTLRSLEVLPNGDLLLEIYNNIRVEIFISSSGYESFDFSIAGKRYIGCGGGKLAIL
jgi:hypothetical protein